jgi:hypothetical protein
MLNSLNPREESNKRINSISDSFVRDSKESEEEEPVAP